jgi:uncharacterized protein YbjT (DUF2867 family)
MTKRNFAIMGATGHVGSMLAEELLKEGHHVRAIGRDKKKLQSLKEKGAEIIQGNFEDHQTLLKAFQNCDGVFTMLPPAYNVEDFEAYQDRIIESICQAVEKSGVEHVVNLSSIGAQLASGTGPIKGLHRLEEALNQIPGVNVVHLRPGYFMENFFWSIPLIKMRGVSGSALKGDIALPMIAARDIGQKAAELLDQLQFQGKTVFELSGPKMLTMEEATTILGKAIGKPDLKYRQFPLSDAEKGMVSIGLKLNAARMLLEMQQAMNENKILPTQSLTGEHLCKTTMETFAKTTFAEQYAGQSLLSSIL